MKYIKFIASLLIITNCCFGNDKTIIRSIGIQSVVLSYVVKKLNESGDKWYKCLKYDESILKVIPKVISDVYLQKNPIQDDVQLTSQSHYNYAFLCELIKEKINDKKKSLDDLLDDAYKKLSSKYDNKNCITKAMNDIKAYMTSFEIDKLLNENLLEKDDLYGFFKYNKYKKKQTIYVKTNKDNRKLKDVYMYMELDSKTTSIMKMKLGCHEYNLDYKLSEDIYLYDVIKDYNPKHNIILRFQEPNIRTYLNSYDRKITGKNQVFDKDGNVTVTYQWDKDAKNDYVEFTSNLNYDISGITLTELGQTFDKQITIVIEGDTYGHETEIAPEFLCKLQGCYDNSIKTNAKINLIFKKKNNRNVLIYHNQDTPFKRGYGIFRNMSSLTEVDLSGAIFVLRTIKGCFRNTLANNYMFYACSNLRKIIWNKDVKTKLCSANHLFSDTSLEEIDMSSFYAAEFLKSINSICSYCDKLKRVNISSLSHYDEYNNPNIEDAGYAFNACCKLEKVELCDLTACNKFEKMFYRTPKNVELDKTKLPQNFKWELKDND